MGKLLETDCIVMDLDEQNKEEILEILGQKLLDSGRIDDLEAFLENVKEREHIEPTAIGDNIGMPHGRTDHVIIPSLCFARLKEPIIWNEKTNETASIIIMIAVPKEDNTHHLKIISQLARNLMHDEFKALLVNGDQKSVYRTINNVLIEV